RRGETTDRERKLLIESSDSYNGEQRQWSSSGEQRWRRAAIAATAERGNSSNNREMSTA
ncbi:hypothetical protein BHM03_00022654, partial [Ensete ventricosum]